MNEKPILFSAPMVRAILDGRKTQTRRIVKEQSLHRDDGDIWTGFLGWQPIDWALANPGACGKGCLPRWVPGDRLWVRETVRADKDWENDVIGVRYLADDFFQPLQNTDEAIDNHFRLRCYNSTDPDLDAYKKVPAIHMPRWASRITLEVTDVRIQRLQDISEDDAIAEGIDRLKFPEVGDWGWPQRAYADLWDHINGAGSWGANPFVVALTFRRLPNAT